MRKLPCWTDEGARRDIVEALLLRPAVVHDTDNELVMAQICANRWPCAEMAEILDIARRHYGVPAASQTPAATHAPVVALSPPPAPPTAPTLTWADVEALLR